MNIRADNACVWCGVGFVVLFLVGFGPRHRDDAGGRHRGGGGDRLPDGSDPAGVVGVRGPYGLEPGPEPVGVRPALVTDELGELKAEVAAAHGSGPP